jgi:hypothetical protein
MLAELAELAECGSKKQLKQMKPTPRVSFDASLVLEVLRPCRLLLIFSHAKKCVSFCSFFHTDI